MELSCEDQRGLSGRDVVQAGVICAGMCSVFWFFSSGASLQVTFVPGALVSLALVVLLYRTGAPLPTPARALPVYAVAMGWQVLHFAEEYQTGFAAQFPELYGGPPYPLATFVWFNMASYLLFSAATFGAVVHRRSALLMPSLFFVVYGTLGNAVAHVVWAVMAGGYFPGLVTACGYFVIGPVLLSRMWPGCSWRQVTGTVLALGVVLVPLLVVVATG